MSLICQNLILSYIFHVVCKNPIEQYNLSICYSISPATVGSHISVPLAPLQAPTKSLRMPVGTAVSAAGKLIQMPVMATSNPPTGVTIQKTTITGNLIFRT